MQVSRLSNVANTAAVISATQLMISATGVWRGGGVWGCFYFLLFGEVCSPVRYKASVNSNPHWAQPQRCLSFAHKEGLHLLTSCFTFQTSSHSYLQPRLNLQAGTVIFSPLKNLLQADHHDQNHNLQDVSNFRIQPRHIPPWPLYISWKDHLDQASIVWGIWTLYFTKGRIYEVKLFKGASYTHLLRARTRKTQREVALRHRGMEAFIRQGWQLPSVTTMIHRSSLWSSLWLE